MCVSSRSVVMCKYICLLFVLLQVRLFCANSTTAPPDESVTTEESSLPTTSISEESLSSTDTSHGSGCPSNRCIRKCCQSDKIFWLYENRCVEPSNDDGNWRIYANSRFAIFDVIFDSRCSGGLYVLNETNDDEYQLFDNGTIHDLTSNEYFSFEDYCIDYVAEDQRFSPLVCYNDSAEQKEEFHFSYYSYGLCASNVFLIVTLGLYVATPPLRRKVHDKCFLCHVATLIIGFSSIIGIQNITPESDYCTFLAYMSQFWLLASFCWLNIMCIDMWRSMDAVKSPVHSSSRTLIIYCLYAWGCPLLIFGITFAANRFMTPGDHMKPDFGINGCWLKNYDGDWWRAPRFLYFYGIISVTLLINFYAFADTAFSIFYQNKRWKTKNNKDSQRHEKEQTRFFLYLKLFLVMGLNWVIEVVSYYSNGTEGVWIVMDIGNSLQGVFIFAIFVCNKRVLLLLEKRFLPRKVFLKEYSRRMSSRIRTVSSRSTTLYHTDSVTNEITLNKL